MTKETVLVTGGAGFIGSHTVDALIALGHKVVIIDNLSTGKRENVNPEAIFYEMDIRDAEIKDVFHEERPNVMYHFAAQMDVRKSIEDPKEDAFINIWGALNMLGIACGYMDCIRKIIFSSTGGAIYGEPKYLPVDEAHPINPLSPYGVTKRAFEMYLPIYKELYGLDYTILRYPNVYGPRQDPNGEAGVIAIFIGKMLKGEPVTIYGDGRQERDYVFVEDIVKANLLAMDKGSGETINLGTQAGISVNKMYRTIHRWHLPQKGSPALTRPPRDGEVSQIYLDCKKAIDYLEWVPRIPLSEGLKLTWNYQKDNQ